MMFRATEIFAGLTVNFLIVCRKNHLECFVSAIPNIENSKAMHRLSRFERSLHQVGSTWLYHPKC